MLGVCGPFTDFTDAAFCVDVLEIYYLGVTTGTTPTTYDPASNVTRLQMAIFLSREADRLLQRGSRRAALGQFWNPRDSRFVKVTGMGATGPLDVRSDGTDVWVTIYNSGLVNRVRGADGRLLEMWSGAAFARGLTVAAGKVFIAGDSAPGNLFRIDPRQPAGAVTTVASNLDSYPIGIAYDGSRLWTANFGGAAGSVSIVTPGATLPWTVTTVTAGFTHPGGAVFDGANVWVTDGIVGKLFKLDGSGAILQTVTMAGFSADAPLFDGSNLWVLNAPGAVTVVKGSSGAILATLTGNGLNEPSGAAFDGERILVTNNSGDSVSLWKASDLSPLGTFPTGTSTNPAGACSDGVSFWIALHGSNQVARF